MALLQAIAIGLIALILKPGQLFYFDVTPKVAILLVGTAALLIRSVWKPSPPLRLLTIVTSVSYTHLTPPRIKQTSNEKQLSRAGIGIIIPITPGNI